MDIIQLLLEFTTVLKRYQIQSQDEACAYCILHTGVAGIRRSKVSSMRVNKSYTVITTDTSMCVC